MFVNFPNPKEAAEKLKRALEAHHWNDALSIERALRQFQHHTIMELANALDGAARQIEVQRAQVLPVDIYTTAQALREWATKIESGEKP
jgi:hypothetical protein